MDHLKPRIVSQVTQEAKQECGYQWNHTFLLLTRLFLKQPVFSQTTLYSCKVGLPRLFQIDIAPFQYTAWSSLVIMQTSFVLTVHIWKQC